MFAQQMIFKVFMPGLEVNNFDLISDKDVIGNEF
jgi:hypothetical protein